MGGLFIGQGNPWWLSPNVWAVPAANPTLPSPGVLHPVVGEQYYINANVGNDSPQPFLDVNVYFFVANPSVGIITSVNAKLIGTWSGEIDAALPNPLISTVSSGGPPSYSPPWIPAIENQGHECIIAAIVQGALTPPAVLNGDNYPPTIAQHNLGVVQTTAHMKGRFQYAFEVCNTARVERSFTVAAEAARPADAARILKSLGREASPGERYGNPEHLGFMRTHSAAPLELDAPFPLLEGMKLAPLSCTSFSLVGTLREGTSLIHVTQRFEERIVGGLSVLIVAEDKARA
jgi:hypothetical protein